MLLLNREYSNVTCICIQDMNIISTLSHGSLVSLNCQATSKSPGLHVKLTGPIYKTITTIDYCWTVGSSTPPKLYMWMEIWHESLTWRVYILCSPRLLTYSFEPILCMLISLVSPWVSSSMASFNCKSWGFMTSYKQNYQGTQYSASSTSGFVGKKRQCAPFFCIEFAHFQERSFQTPFHT